MPLQSEEGYHAPAGRSVTDFTVVRWRKRSLHLLQVREAVPGPSRHFAAAQQTVALGVKADIGQGAQTTP